MQAGQPDRLASIGQPVRGGACRGSHALLAFVLIAAVRRMTDIGCELSSF